MNDPLEKRRFMAVRFAVQVRHEKIASLPHFPGYRDDAGFIDGYKRSEGKAKEDENTPEKSVIPGNRPVWHRYRCYGLIFVMENRCPKTPVLEPLHPPRDKRRIIGLKVR